MTNGLVRLLSNGKNALLVNCGQSCPKRGVPAQECRLSQAETNNLSVMDLKGVPLSKISKWNQWLDLSEGVTLLEISWPPWLCHGEALGGFGMTDSWFSDPDVPAFASCRKQKLT